MFYELFIALSAEGRGFEPPTRVIPDGRVSVL